MSRALVPRPLLGEPDMSSSQSTQKPRKISSACGACKLRKTRCTGSSPCEACSQRGSACLYDATTDQRRKIANQRNLHELQGTQVDLERHKQLLGGIIAIVRAGDSVACEEMIESIRSEITLSQLAAHVRNARRADPRIDNAFSQIDFTIDGIHEDLPSPTQLLNTAMGSKAQTSRDSISSASGDNMPSMSSILTHDPNPEPRFEAHLHGRLDGRFEERFEEHFDESQS